MRRSDREIVDSGKMDEIISRCHCCRLGFYDGEEVYIVSLNFGFCRQERNRHFYFHSAKEGRKIELITKAPKVSFELDTGYALQPGETACQHSARYQSVMGVGRVSLVEDAREKEAALQLIMQHNTGKGDWAFSPAMLDCVCVFQLEVEKISCKEHV